MPYPLLAPTLTKTGFCRGILSASARSHLPSSGQPSPKSAPQRDCKLPAQEPLPLPAEDNGMAHVLRNSAVPLYVPASDQVKL